MRVAAVAAILLSTAAAAAAQDAGAVVGASVAVSSMNSTNSLTFTGSGGYRFNRYVGLEVEITAVPTVKGPFSSAPELQFPTEPIATVAGTLSGLTGIVGSAFVPVSSLTNQNGRAVFFTTNVRVEMPTASGRITPFFVAGGGSANLRRTADLTLPIGGPIVFVNGAPVPTTSRTITEPLTSSATDLALTIGGGVSVGVGAHASIDGDLRFFRMLGETDTNAGRFGVGLRYRF